jgi:predicted metal-dependent peptidase
MTKLTAEQRVQRAHVALMNDPRYCLFSGVFMVGKTEVVENVPTACTDGRNTKYGRKFVDKLTEQELRALILHENKHKAFRHMSTWKNLWDENPKLANMACDYVINLMIYDSDKEGKFVKLPEGGLLDEQFRGMDAGTVFKLLKQQGKGRGKGKGKDDDGDGDGQGDSPSDGSSDDPSEGDSGGGLDDHDWESGESMTREEKDALAKDIDQALRQGAILAGKMKGNVPREVTDALTPKVDWREVLREFVKSVCSDRDESTWRRPSRRWIGQDVYMPSSISTAVGRIAVAVDTSGSIDGAQISQFLGELKSICDTVKPEGIDLLYWDTAVCQHEKYERGDFDNILRSTKPRGGGGTDPRCITEYLRSNRVKPECCVVLTDGYVSSWGDSWPCPVLWGITTVNITSPVGKSVTIK